MIPKASSSLWLPCEVTDLHELRKRKSYCFKEGKVRVKAGIFIMFSFGRLVEETGDRVKDKGGGQ